MRSALVGAFLGCALLSSNQAPAQEPPAPLQFSVGYSVMHDDYVDKDFTLGWVATLNRDITRVVSVVGEGGGSYWHEQVDSLTLLPYSIFVHSLLGGIRVSPAGRPRATVFGQILGGWARRTRTSPGASFAPANEGDVNGLSIQPGGGVDFKLSRLYAVRVQGDYRIVRGNDIVRQTQKQTRVLAAMVIGVER